MDILTSISAYEKLLDVEYQITLGKKKKTLSFVISFQKINFPHLAGLHYLEDIPDIFRSSRDIIFDKILSGIISKKQIESSVFYPQIKDRIEYLSYLEQIIDSNETIFRYNPQTEAFSAIQAEFLMKNEIQSRNVFVFLSQEKSSGKYFCRSFFPQTDKDYSENQAKWALLHKKKINKTAGEETILYDRMK